MQNSTLAYHVAKVLANLSSVNNPQISPRTQLKQLSLNFCVVKFEDSADFTDLNIKVCSITINTDKNSVKIAGYSKY